MNKADIATIFDFNDWANRRILASAARVSEEQLIAPTPFPYGSQIGRASCRERV